MKICVIGNSHCSAVVTAWRQHFKGTTDDTLTFFAAPGRRAKRFKISDGCLVAKGSNVTKMIRHTSDGKTRVEPELYDRFLVYGLIPQPSATDEGGWMSAALQEAIVSDRVLNSTARLIVAMLREITDKPIDVAPAPFKFAMPGISPATWALDLDEEARLFQSNFESLDARYWPQPAETVVQGGTRATLPQFSEGSVRLQVNQDRSHSKHGEHDTKHANDAFGKLWLKAYLGGLN